MFVTYFTSLFMRHYKVDQIQESQKLWMKFSIYSKQKNFSNNGNRFNFNYFLSIE